MKRRDFSLMASGAALAVGTVWSPAAQAQAAKFEAGDDYVALETRAPVDAPPGKVEVVEFFWYSCPHCNAFEPMLAAWVKKLPKEVAFRRVPVAFRDDFVPLQRLYYALEAMGLVEQLHAKVFAAIHVDRNDLSKNAAILDWVGKQGVDKAKFSDQFNSFSVASKATKAAQLQNSYKVEGVPALGIAGRYYTDGSLAKGMERALKVVESLVVAVRSGK
jgi:protein dithiol oxidoreductase (disulfide-forming)